MCSALVYEAATSEPQQDHQVSFSSQKIKLNKKFKNVGKDIKILNRKVGGTQISNTALKQKLCVYYTAFLVLSRALWYRI
jgi:hypothetical protein